MNDILAVYLKAYTSKKAADSVADDIAVGTGSGLLGGLAGYAGGAIRGDYLRKSKGSKLENILRSLRRRIDATQSKYNAANKEYIRAAKRLTEAERMGSASVPYFESALSDRGEKLFATDKLLSNQQYRYGKTLGKAAKLQNALKKSKRVGGVAGAVGAGLLGSLLYNKLKKD